MIASFGIGFCNESEKILKIKDEAKRPNIPEIEIRIITSIEFLFLMFLFFVAFIETS